MIIEGRCFWRKGQDPEFMVWIGVAFPSFTTSWYRVLYKNTQARSCGRHCNHGPLPYVWHLEASFHKL